MVEAYELQQKRLDSRTALVCASVYNANRTKKDKLIKPEQFMPKEATKKQKQSPDEMLRIAEMMTRMKGGKDLRKETANNDIS
jgi:hypothetical protein